MAKRDVVRRVVQVAWVLGAAALGGCEVGNGAARTAAVVGPATRQGTSAALAATFTDLGSGRRVAAAGMPDFGLHGGESVHPRVGAKFRAEYEGELKVLQRGRYAVWAEGSGSIWIDGTEVDREGVELNEGAHPLRVEYERNSAGIARLRLMWKSDAFPAEPVPVAALTHNHASAEEQVWEGIERGRMLVEEMNCVGCHRSERSGVGGRRGPNLATVGSRLNEEWVYRWLGDPRKLRDGAGMPVLLTRERDRRDVAAYLATLKSPRERPAPEAAMADMVAQGKKDWEAIGCAACHGKGAVPVGAVAEKYRSWVELADYLQDPLAVDPSGRMPSMMLSRDEALGLAAYLYGSSSSDAEPPSKGDAPRGEQLVRTAGCLNCHSVEAERPEKGKPKRTAASRPAVSTSTSAPFEKLRAGRGCLAKSPGGRAARYGFTAEEREAINAFVQSLAEAPVVSKAPAYELRRTVAKFRCTSCHELDELRPAEESEHVPPLTMAGERLQKKWIEQVLTDPTKRARPWFKRRMPYFGAENVSDVAGQIVAASGADEREPAVAPTREQIGLGQKLAGKGTEGLACITCHSFGGESAGVADATRGPEMTTMASRVRGSWFRRWLYDPKRIVPNTAMPTFFANKPPEEAKPTIEALWGYVSLRGSMPPPPGWVDTQNYTVSVDKEPAVMRCYMPGEGKGIPRGIAVGLPGLVSYCFDADTCAVRYAWVGGFLDMKPQWSGRGGGQAKLLGRKFYSTDAFPIRIGDPEHEPKPEFDGYELEKDGPAFTYRVDGVRVEQRVKAVEHGFGLVEGFEVEDAVGKPVYFAKSGAAGVTYSASDGAIDEGNAFKITGEGNVKFSVTIHVKEGK